MLRALFLTLAISGIVDLGDGWQYALSPPRTTPPGDEVSWQEAVDDDPNREIWYRATLPASLPPDARFVFRSYGGEFDLFVEQQRIYAFHEPGARDRLRLHDVALPHDAAGRRLYVRLARGERRPLFGRTPSIASRAATPLALLRAVNDPLRDDIADLLIGAVLLILGILSFGISRLRRRGSASALLWFGLFTAIYGLRLIAETSLPVTLGLSLWEMRFVGAALTYFINIPGWLLARTFFGDGWRGSIRWQIAVFMLFAPIGLISDIAQQTPESLGFVNNALVILGGLNIVLNLLHKRPRQTHELRVVSLGAGVFLLFALLNNASSLGFLPWRNLRETPGFVTFVATLGYAATRSFLRGEREQLAIESELSAAREIQRSILPAEMPSIEGLRFSSRYVPATSVAGDVYDFIATDARRTGVLVADVAGHGVPAALIASIVKIVASSQRELAEDPAAMLLQLNQTLKREVRRTLVTATVLHLDMDSRLIRVANAGHAPPLLLRNGAFRTLGPNGVLLGRFGDAIYIAEETALECGDRITAWTDGIVEARNAHGEEFGEERLRNVLRGQSNAADAVIDAVIAWRDRDSEADDLTIVVIDVE